MVVATSLSWRQWSDVTGELAVATSLSWRQWSDVTGDMAVATSLSWRQWNDVTGEMAAATSLSWRQWSDVTSDMTVATSLSWRQWSDINVSMPLWRPLRSDVYEATSLYRQFCLLPRHCGDSSAPTSMKWRNLSEVTVGTVAVLTSSLTLTPCTTSSYYQNCSQIFVGGKPCCFSAVWRWSFWSFYENEKERV